MPKKQKKEATQYCLRTAIVDRGFTGYVIINTSKDGVFATCDQLYYDWIGETLDDALQRVKSGLYDEISGVAIYKDHSSVVPSNYSQHTYGIRRQN